MFTAAMITNDVKALRERKGVSKAHLARRVGVNRSFITRLEQGRAQPSARLMFKIAGYFGCEISVAFQCDESVTATARPAAGGKQPDKSLVAPAAKAVASPVA